VSIAVITGSAGLAGSAAVEKFHEEGFDILGIDNDMRATFFGPLASTTPNREKLEKRFSRYRHESVDIRNQEAIEKLFKERGKSIAVVVHTASQPSHDWAAREPLTDFHINASGTLNLLEATRHHCPEAVFIFSSTNKVYGDTPNHLPLVEQEKRWEIDSRHPYFAGIDETMSVDQTKHSLFGASKLAGDILVQEYGRYFGMKTSCFRAGCITGPAHAGTELHGFLSYLVKCVRQGIEYRVFGYKGKQVRDNIHSHDLVEAFWQVFQQPRIGGEVYNMGGGRHSNCSVLEAIEKCETLAGKKLKWDYVDQERSGDHIWWISSVARFQSHYPGWSHRYGLDGILKELLEAS